MDEDKCLLCLGTSTRLTIVPTTSPSSLTTALTFAPIDTWRWRNRRSICACLATQVAAWLGKSLRVIQSFHQLLGSLQMEGDQLGEPLSGQTLKQIKPSFFAKTMSHRTSHPWVSSALFPYLVSSATSSSSLRPNSVTTWGQWVESLMHMSRTAMPSMISTFPFPMIYSYGTLYKNYTEALQVCRILG